MNNFFFRFNRNALPIFLINVTFSLFKFKMSNKTAKKVAYSNYFVEVALGKGNDDEKKHKDRLSAKQYSNSKDHH